MIASSSGPADLLRRLQAFSIDGPGQAALPFSARLAREHGWSRAYAERAIEEYKRFVFLALTANTPVCPSEEVDAAWHLHLTYTRSYWKRFCGEVLGQPLHHEPTNGGPAEAEKHLAMYQGTLAAYRRAFDAEPPTDVWPAADVRFGDDLKQRVVNTARNWVISKAAVRKIAAILGLAGLTVPLLTGCAAGVDPLALKGAYFLFFLIPALLCAIGLGRVLRSQLRLPGPQAGDEERKWTWEQVAYLAGGAPRLATAAIARLVERGAARVSEEDNRAHRIGSNPADLSEVERAVWATLPVEPTPKSLKRTVRAVKESFAGEISRLKEEGFVLTFIKKLGIVLTSLIPLAVVLLGFAWPRLQAGLAAGKPVGYLSGTLLIGAPISLIIVLAGRLPVSRRGDAVVNRMQTSHSSLKLASGSEGNAGLAVARLGAAALAGSELAVLATWFPRPSSADGGCGAGCSAGGCGGGDGGGGCGGCGGGAEGAAIECGFAFGHVRSKSLAYIFS